jgi:hypothetical protein
MIEAARTSETLVNFYQITRHYNLEDSHLLDIYEFPTKMLAHIQYVSLNCVLYWKDFGGLYKLFLAVKYGTFLENLFKFYHEYRFSCDVENEKKKRESLEMS